MSIAKVASDEQEAWRMQETYADVPHGWVQWKGTSVCMDVYCKCGNQSHIDNDFVYNWQCPYCGTVYMCNGHIEMIEVTADPSSMGIIRHPEREDWDGTANVVLNRPVTVSDKTYPTGTAALWVGNGPDGVVYLSMVGPDLSDELTVPSHVIDVVEDADAD